MHPAALDITYMPELPDISVYLRALDRFVGEHEIRSISVRSPFVVRTFDPDITDCAGRRISGLRRIGKRIVWELDDDLFIVFHLMIAGRFHWKQPDTRPTRKVDLAAFAFTHGTLMLTEASAKKRASIHVLRSAGQLETLASGGIEVMECSA